MEILSDPTPGTLAMSRFDDGVIDIHDLLRRLAEQVVNVDDGRRGRPAVRRRDEQPQRLPGAQPRHLRRHADAAHPEAPHRQLLPRRRD